MVTGHQRSRSGAGRRAAWRARRRQRGASIFVVMSAIVVLTAIGIFAAHTAGLNQRMSGYARQGTQSAYVADLGTVAAVDELSSGAAPAYMQLVTSGAESCRANQYVTDTPGLPCYRISKADIEKRMELEDGAASELLDPSGLSSELAALEADFVVELTDPGPAGRPVAGMEQSGIGPRFRYMQLTLSGTGMVRPDSDSGPSDDSIAKLSTVRANRAVVQVGPLPR